MQLPDTLNLLSGSMRAGFSFAQGLESVANEATEPTRRELQRVFTESRLGRPIEDALEDSANRMTSVDLMWAVMAIRIQREVGGNLAELLDTVADTMTAARADPSRDQGAHRGGALLRDRSSASSRSRSRASSTWSQPDYISELFHNSVGIMAMIGSGIMTFFGFLWLRKILAIEV